MNSSPHCSVAVSTVADLSERALVGCLLNASVGQAREWLTLFTADDLDDVKLRLIVELIAGCAAGGRTPSADVVFAAGRSTGEVWASGLPAFSAELVDLATNTAMAAWAPLHAAEVVAASLRRRASQTATRLGQAAETASTEALLAVIETEAIELVTAMHRVNGSAVA